MELLVKWANIPTSRELLLYTRKPINAPRRKVPKASENQNE